MSEPAAGSGTRIRLLPLALLFAFVAFSPSTAVRAEEEPEVSVNVSSQELYFGESLTLQVTEQDVKTPVRPDLTVLEADFTMQAAGDQTMNQSSVMIINGQRIDRSFYGHVFRYRLTPKRAGPLTIPTITVEIGGKSYSTQPVPLNVIAPEKQDLVLTEITVKPERVFPTQSFEVTLRILVKPLPDQPQRDPLTPLRRQPPRISINWVDPLPDGLTATSVNEWLGPLQSRQENGFTINEIAGNNVFAFFERSLAIFDLAAGREKRNVEGGPDVDYFVYELKRTFVAQKEGTYPFGPANMKGTFVSGMRGREYSGRQIYTIAEAKTVEVKAIPSPRPATFCGGVGGYVIAAQATPTTLRVGDPLALTLAFTRSSGAGSLELVSAPNLRSVEALAADFDIADETPTGEVKGDTKRFVYTVRPKKTDVSIPALPVTLFDPSTEQFTQVQTVPIPLRVTDASRLKAGDLVVSTTTPDVGKGVELRSRSEGIFQNVTAVAEIGNQHVSPRLYLFTAALVLFGYGLLWAGVLVWRRVSSDPAWQRRQAARGNAERGLKEAHGLLSAGKNEEALRALRGALTGLVADMLNLPAAGLTVHEAAEAVRTSGISDASCLEINRVLEALDALEYGAKSTGELGGALDSTAKLLPILHKELSERK